MRIVYHPHAEAELVEAARFYEKRLPTLGSQWLDATDQALAKISATPTRWRIIEKDVRRYLMPRFPYTIYYRALVDEVRILAFKHHKRHPGYWHYRLNR